MSDAPKPAPQHHRSVRNYLLDRNFQLKYAGLLAGTALVLSLALGVLVWRTSSEAITQGQKTVERGQLVVVQSRKVSSGRLDEHRHLLQGRPRGREDVRRGCRQGRAAAEGGAGTARARRGLPRPRSSGSSLGGLVALLGVLVVAMGALGIVFTHKVAGPIFKMKRLLREVGAGKLAVRERLRKGDELQHFFEAFEQMVGELRRRQEAEIARVDQILEKLSDAPVSTRGLKEFDEDGIEMLRQLRREMQEQLDG